MMDRLAPTDIETFLRANPAFLAERPELYRVLDPPLRVHGETLADHMQARLAAAQSRAREMEQHAADLLQSQRAAIGITERVQTAVLALVAADDPAECVADTFPALLGVDAAILCCERYQPHWRTLPPGAIRVLMQGRDVVFRDRPDDAVLLHAEAALLAERDVLVRLPSESPALLALVTRDPEVLPAMRGVSAFAFLGRVLASLVDR